MLHRLIARTVSLCLSALLTLIEGACKGHRSHGCQQPLGPAASADHALATLAVNDFPTDFSSSSLWASPALLRIP